MNIRVPRYDSQKHKLRPLHTQGLNVRVPKSAFSIDATPGANAMMRGLSNMRENLDLAKEIEDKAVIQERVDEYTRNTDFMLYDSKEGFTAKRGKNAVESEEDFFKNIEKAKVTYAKGLNPEQTERFYAAVAAIETNKKRSALVHTRDQRKAWVNNAAEAFIETQINSAIAASDNEESFNFSVDAAMAEVQENGELNGLSDEAIELNKQAVKDNVFTSVIRKKLASNVFIAETYLEHVKHMLSSQALEKVDAFVAPALQAGKVSLISTGVQKEIANSPTPWTDAQPLINEIDDPNIRHKVRNNVKRAISDQNSVKAELRYNAERVALNAILTDQLHGIHELPFEISDSLGVNGVTAVGRLIDMMEDDTERETNLRTKSNLLSLAALDPERFSRIDLINNYGDQLSKKDLVDFIEKRGQVIAQLQRDREGTLNVASQMKEAIDFARGILRSSMDSDKFDSGKQEARRVYFNSVLIEQVEYFRSENNRMPNRLEMLDIAKDLLTPVELENEGGIFGTKKTRTIRAFEIDRLAEPDDEITFAQPYEDITRTDKRKIIDMLRAEGRTDINKDDVEKRYNEELMKRLLGPVN